MKKVGFIIFSHSEYQDVDDLEDLISNINHYCENSDFLVNHPNINHRFVRTKYQPGKLDESNFIFGALIEIIKSLTLEEIQNYSHFCLVSANQYFINKINLKENTNYVQFYNKENWENKYDGKNFDKSYEGFPLNQEYGRWDNKDLYKKFGISSPMAANWECLIFTDTVMKLSKENYETFIDFYPNCDLMNIFLPYMVLLSNQSWEFPPHFGTYDPSNKPRYNRIIELTQVDEKKRNDYFSIKRVNYSKDCPIKKYIRENFMI